jgi:hypothetical protein
MRIQLVRRREGPVRQRVFEFIERRRRHERWFKRLIVWTTTLVVVLILTLVPLGLYVSLEIAESARSVALRTVGIQRSRITTDESWKRYRQLGIDDTRPKLARLYAESDPPFQRLMRYARMDPENGLLRWGNYNWTLLLSPAVFEADDAGRSFRFRPLTHSIWLRNLPLQSGVTMFFLMPDGPGLADAIRGTKARVVETSRQFTNSWGLRGPEPDLDAPLRGIVLGDSFMEGMFIGDDETPPECLARCLRDHLRTRTSILNTGVMGYSPEQYYYSLIAFADRFQPHFVVTSVFTNDFGDIQDVARRGEGDWEEGKYWLQQIVNFCRKRQWPCLIVPAPFRPNVLERRYSGNYPGMLSNILDISSPHYLDPIDDFINEHLKIVSAAMRKGVDPRGCHLFLNDLGDDHFSAAGSAVWADSVGKRLILLMERDSAGRERHAAVARGQH